MTTDGGDSGKRKRMWHRLSTAWRNSDETSARTILKHEMHQFILKTSLKGAPRIIKTKHRSIAVFWIFAVVFLLTSTVFFTTNVVLEYFEYNTNVNIREYDPQKADDRHALRDTYGFNFPAITVCNQLPFRHDYELDLPPGVITEEQYFTQLIQLWQTTSDSVRSELQVWSYLIYLAMRSHLVFYNGTSVGQTKESFLVQCHYIEFDEATGRHVPCDQSAIIEHLYLENKFTCFKLKINESMINSDDVIGLTMTLYVDAFQSFVPQENFARITDHQQHSGVRLFMHKPDSYAQTFDASIHFAPGQRVEVETQSYARKMLPAPYEHCTEDGLQIIDIARRPVPYSRQSCVKACQQNAVTSTCGCLYPTLMVMFQNFSSQLFATPFCPGVFTFDTFNDTVARVECAQSVSKDVQQACVRNCPVNCTELTFSFEYQSDQWPTSRRQLAFYNDLIKQPALDVMDAVNCSDVNDCRQTASEQTTAALVSAQAHNEVINRWRNFHDTYEPIAGLAGQGNASQEVVDRLLASRLIENNFVKLTIKFGDRPFLAYESEAAMNVYNLLSNLGGILNLYAGITFVLVFELIELCGHLLISWRSKRNQNGENATNQINPIRVRPTVDQLPPPE